MLEIRESQIEDIFASQLDEVRHLLSVEGDISLISRQKKLPSGGKLDLLYISSQHLLLLELKAVRSETKFCDQILEYIDDLLLLQYKDELPNLPIKAFLLCPEFLDSHKQYCKSNEITPIMYSPYELLKNYFFKVKAISNLISLKPSNHGLWNLHLLNRILYQLNKSTPIDSLVLKVGLSKSTVNSYLRISTELGLTMTKPNIDLTELGRNYVKNKENDKPIDHIGDAQTEILSGFITQNPFYSPAIYGIYSAVESIFALSKNFYPVPLKEASSYFTLITGKQNEWAEKAKKDAFIMYSNYGLDLGLLAKMGRNYYLTPAGIKFILLLELNKSILFVNSL